MSALTDAELDAVINQVCSGGGYVAYAYEDVVAVARAVEAVISADSGRAVLLDKISDLEKRVRYQRIKLSKLDALARGGAA